MSDLSVQTLLDTATVRVVDLCCDGRSDHHLPASLAESCFLQFPYRGVFVQHFGDSVVVAESSQVLLQNPNEPCLVSHPVAGGDASLAVLVDTEMLAELAPVALMQGTGECRFALPRLRVDPRAQVLVALLRHSLREQIAETLEAESLALTLVQRSLGAKTTRAATASISRQRLVDRAKLVLTQDLSRRLSLADIATEVGISPVYLTQAFQQVEGLPLYRYQLRLRLARALDLLAEYDDLTELGLALGFSSHSHFSSAFQQAYGRSPTEFRKSALQR